MFSHLENTRATQERNFFTLPQETKRDTLPFSDQLPYSTTPKSFNTSAERFQVPQSTNSRGSFVCFNTELAKTPFYLRSWPSFEVPRQRVDTTKDPRYSVSTKIFSQNYKSF